MRDDRRRYRRIRVGFDMKKLEKLANILDQVKRYSAADKVDEILKSSTSIKKISPSDTRFDMNKRKEDSSSYKRKEDKKDISFEELLKQMSEEVSDKNENEPHTEKEDSGIDMKTLIDMIKP